MNRKRKTLEKFANELGLVMAKDFFETFSDPSNCGPNFEWDKFPNMVVRFTKTQLFIGCSPREYERLGKELEKIACDVAFEEATRLIEEKSNGNICNV